MKKSLICTCLLFLVSVIGITAAHRLVTQESLALEWTESTYAGDFTAADGLTAQLTTHCNYNLFWDTTLPFGHKPETTFQYVPKQRFPEQTSAIYMDVCLNHSWESLGATLSLDELDDSQKALLSPLIDEVKSGSTVTKTVHLQDFCPFYPTEWAIRIPHNDLNPWSSRKTALEIYPNSALLYELADAFRFPVLPDHTVVLSATRDAEGQLTKCSISDSSRSVSSDVIFHVTEDFAYFIPELKTSDGTPLDSSHTPNGRGIYRLPCADRRLTLDDLEFFYPIADNQTVLDLCMDYDEKHFLLATVENGVTAIHVLDAVSGREIQVLTPWETSIDWVQLISGQGCLMVERPGGSFVLYAADSNGLYIPQFTGQWPDPEKFPMKRGSRNILAYNGQQMALLCDQLYSKDPAYCSLALAIFDRTGLQYAGTFDSSLDQCRIPAENDFSYSTPLCMFFGPDALQLDWT